MDCADSQALDAFVNNERNVVERAVTEYLKRSDSPRSEWEVCGAVCCIPAWLHVMRA